MPREVLPAWDWVPASPTFLPGWGLVLLLGRGIACLGELTTWEKVLQACIWVPVLPAFIIPSWGITAYLGRVVNCLRNSTVCLGLSPQLGTSTVCLRGVASPACLRRNTNCLGKAAICLGRIVNCLESSTACLGMGPCLWTGTVYLGGVTY